MRRIRWFSLVHGTTTRAERNWLSACISAALAISTRAWKSRGSMRTNTWPVFTGLVVVYEHVQHVAGDLGAMAVMWPSTWASSEDT